MKINAIINVAVAPSFADIIPGHNQRTRARGPALLPGIGAGTVRQVMWGAPVLMIISFSYVRRKDRVLVATAGTLLLILAFSVIVCLHWLYSQPFAYREELVLPQTIKGIHLLLRNLVFTMLTIAMVCLPAFFYLSGIERLWQGAAFSFFSTIVLNAVEPHFRQRKPPFRIPPEIITALPFSGRRRRWQATLRASEACCSKAQRRNWCTSGPHGRFLHR